MVLSCHACGHRSDVARTAVDCPNNIENVAHNGLIGAAQAVGALAYTREWHLDSRCVVDVVGPADEDTLRVVFVKSECEVASGFDAELAA